MKKPDLAEPPSEQVEHPKQGSWALESKGSFKKARRSKKAKTRKPRTRGRVSEGHGRRSKKRKSGKTKRRVIRAI
jgi:hypothetical protein